MPCVPNDAAFVRPARAAVDYVGQVDHLSFAELVQAAELGAGRAVGQAGR